MKEKTRNRLIALSLLAVTVVQPTFALTGAVGTDPWDVPLGNVRKILLTGNGLPVLALIVVVIGAISWLVMDDPVKFKKTMIRVCIVLIIVYGAASIIKTVFSGVSGIETDGAVLTAIQAAAYGF